MQDVSVFMVSNFRLPVFEAEVRELLFRVSRRMFDFASTYARRVGDETFQARLALGIARSLITSTRFELDEQFARAMYIRAVYLLEHLRPAEGRRPEEYKFNPEILIF